MSAFTWGEIQQMMAKSLECPYCGALVVNRTSHAWWHEMLHDAREATQGQAHAMDEVRSWADGDNP